MIVLAVLVGRVAITPENYSAFLVATRAIFGIFAFLCFLGIFTSLTRGKIIQEPHKSTG